MAPRSPRSRRDFVTALTGVLLGLATVSWSWRSGHRCAPALTAGPHPDPRPDIDASEVLTAEELEHDDFLVELYDGIRAIPHIADGIRCQCGCADTPGYRSLLTCYESGGMAMYCIVCQTEGAMVVRLHEKGYTLEQIRAAVDARLG